MNIIGVYSAVLWICILDVLFPQHLLKWCYFLDSPESFLVTPSISNYNLFDFLTSNLTPHFIQIFMQN